MHAGHGDWASACFARCSTLDDAAARNQQELHSGDAAQRMAAGGGGLGSPLASWPVCPATGSMGAMTGANEGSLYSQLAAAQRHGRPPRPGAGTNCLSAPADLQQELRAFAAGRPISKPVAGGRWPLGAPPAGGSSTFVPFSTEAHGNAAVAERQGQVVWRQFSTGALNPRGHPYDARNTSNYDGGAGVANGHAAPLTAPASITDYAASLIGFGGAPPPPGGYPGAAAVGLHALETGLGLGGSGLATNSVPLLPSALRGGGAATVLGPFQDRAEHISPSWPRLAAGTASHGSHPQQPPSLACLGRTTSTPNAVPRMHPSLPPNPSSLLKSAAQSPQFALPPLEFASERRQRQQASLGSVPDVTLRTASLPAGPHRRLRHRRGAARFDDQDGDWHPEEPGEDEEGSKVHSDGDEQVHATPSPQRKPWHAEVRAAAAAADAAAASGGKPKVGRPRKYDLSADAGSSGAEGSGGATRRGSRAKYASKQEALARRRERNRASALEAYYRGKARRTQLEAQLTALREEDAALHALAAMAHADPGAAVRIRQLLSAGVAAVEVTRRLRSGQ